jgi:hypothetical protein
MLAGCTAGNEGTIVFCNSSPIASCVFVDQYPGGLFVSVVPTLCATSRDVGLESTVVDLAIGATAEGRLEMKFLASAPADVIFAPPTADFALASGIEAVTAGVLFPDGTKAGVAVGGAGNS